MKVLFTICARAGSKGVKGKNTREFCGMPLAAYTVAAFWLFRQRFGAAFEDMLLAVNTDSLLLTEQMDRMGMRTFLFQGHRNCRVIRLPRRM